MKRSDKEKIIDEATMLLSQAFALSVITETCEAHRLCSDCPYYCDLGCAVSCSNITRENHYKEMEKKAIMLSETIKNNRGADNEGV